MKIKRVVLVMFMLTFFSWVVFPQDIQWKHLSTKTNDLQVPNDGKEQTSSIVCDIDKDGVNDFVISERTMAPSVVWYRRSDKGWARYIIEANPLHIEAGSDFMDIDGDGDMDILMGGDYQSNEIWWWENPSPDFDPKVPWVRHTIKSFGNNKHHDQIFGDFNGDGKPELVFWAQGDKTLYIANIPDHPVDAGEWKFTPVYTYNDDSQMEQRGHYADFKGIDEHEGLAKADIDGDGVLDIIAGGRWFRHSGNNKFAENIIDAGYTFSRAAAGQLIKGGRPEVVLVVGDGVAPMIMYEWKKGTWFSKVLIDSVDCGHSLKILDFNSDGNMDIWNAEMRLNDGNPHAKNRLLLGDGKGNFKEMIISEGFGLHESKIADLDGDGDYDILGKPYNWDTPRLDIWLQNGTGGVISKRAHSFNKPVGLELYTLRFEFKKNVPATLEKVKNFGFKEVEVSGYYNTDPKEFKKLLDKNGLKTTSIIFDYGRLLNDLENVVKEAKLFGARTIGCGWIPHNGKFSFADAEKTVKDFNNIGQKLKNAGLSFFYHPHGYEFVYDHDVTLMDYIMENTKPELVSFQLDLFWVLYSGVDPLWFLKKYPTRFTSCHLKDLRSGIDGNNLGTAPDVTSVALGNGRVNFPAFLREAAKLGITKYYIEDEAEDAVDHLPASIKFLESLK